MRWARREAANMAETIRCHQCGARPPAALENELAGVI